MTSVQGREDRHITPDLLEKQAAQAAAAEVPMELVWHDEGHVLRGETLQSVVSGLRTPR